MIDQHAWMDPKNGIVYVRNIAQALGRLDPANAANYKARAAAYVKELQALDAWMRTEMMFQQRSAASSPLAICWNISPKPTALR